MYLTHSDLDRINWRRAQEGRPRLSMPQAEAALRTPAGQAAIHGDVSPFLVGLVLAAGIAGVEAVPHNPPPVGAGTAGVDQAPPANAGSEPLIHDGKPVTYQGTPLQVDKGLDAGDSDAGASDGECA